VPLMARIHTHYDNLKVARDAPPEVIRAAYKTLSQKHHPDRNGNSPDAIRIIQLINSAYEVLSDPLKRQEHDAWIAREELAVEHSLRRRTSHHSRRSSRHDLARSRSGSQISKAVQLAAVMWEHFCRKIFKKA
jgi:curved DNA-binding protein CbpA